MSAEIDIFVEEATLCGSNCKTSCYLILGEVKLKKPNIHGKQILEGCHILGQKIICKCVGNLTSTRDKIIL